MNYSLRREAACESGPTVGEAEPWLSADGHSLPLLHLHTHLPTSKSVLCSLISSSRDFTDANEVGSVTL